MEKVIELSVGFIAPIFGFLAEAVTAEMTTGRVRAIGFAVIGLVSVVVGIVAFVRAGRGKGKIGAIIAVLLGIAGLLFSIMHIVASTAFGTGGGRLGAIVALVLALIGTIFGGLAFTRRGIGGRTGAGWE